jgi:WhiB family redox-sensing transcriptional regulator
LIDQPTFGLQAWMTDAHCRGANAAAFFPSDGTGVEAAQHVCSQCRVRVDCLEYALTMRLDHGVWGGTSERERQRILRQRRELLAPRRPSPYVPKEG